MMSEIIPVIHMLNEKQVLENVNTCIECGIKKVFIINHVVSVDDLTKCAYNVREKHESLWIGVNMLGVSAEKAIGTALKNINGLWIDETVQPYRIFNRKFEGMVFGGLAFKYQPQPTDLKSACEEAKIATDVATTSGAGTGKPADFRKVMTIRNYLGEHPMAIASGVSTDNIHLFKGIADYLLVATSITDRNEMIIENKLRELKQELER